VSNYPKYEKYSKHDRQKKPGIFTRIGFFFQNAKRILKIANKPNRKDYFTVFKICAIGIVILGALSYVIQLIFSVLSSALNIA
jgi:protein translocase SEC61 complex gamma subunit